MAFKHKEVDAKLLKIFNDYGADSILLALTRIIGNTADKFNMTLAERKNVKKAYERYWSYGFRKNVFKERGVM